MIDRKIQFAVSATNHSSDKMRSADMGSDEMRDELSDMNIPSRSFLVRL